MTSTSAAKRAVVAVLRKPLPELLGLLVAVRAALRPLPAPGAALLGGYAPHTPMQNRHAKTDLLWGALHCKGA